VSDSRRGGPGGSAGPPETNHRLAVDVLAQATGTRHCRRSPERGPAPEGKRRARPEPEHRRYADRPAQAARLPGRTVLSIAAGPDAPHVVQIGAAPAFIGAGVRDLVCQCGESVLIQGYLPANFIGIRIRCARCGEVTTTPGLAEGDILPRNATPIAPV